MDRISPGAELPATTAASAPSISAMKAPDSVNTPKWNAVTETPATARRPATPWRAVRTARPWTVTTGITAPTIPATPWTVSASTCPRAVPTTTSARKTPAIPTRAFASTNPWTAMTEKTAPRTVAIRPPAAPTWLWTGPVTTGTPAPPTTTAWRASASRAMPPPARTRRASVPGPPSPASCARDRSNCPADRTNTWPTARTTNQRPNSPAMAWTTTATGSPTKGTRTWTGTAWPSAWTTTRTTTASWTTGTAAARWATTPVPMVRPRPATTTAPWCPTRNRKTRTPARWGTSARPIGTGTARPTAWTTAWWRPTRTRPIWTVTGPVTPATAMRMTTRWTTWA